VSEAGTVEQGPAIGTEAPDFEVRDAHGQPWRLSDYRGKKNVVLVFIPFAFSRGCTSELCAIGEDLSEFQNDETQVAAISCDTPFSLKAWAEKERYDFPMLSDFWPHGAVSQLYGVFEERVGAATRSTFLIDRDGVVRWKVLNGWDLRDAESYKKALAEVS
jgi:peroxiredoxin